MRRFYPSYALLGAAAVLSALIGVALYPEVVQATQDFSAFFAARTAATTPLGSGDKFLVLQSAVDKYLAADQVLTLTGSQTETNKTINGNSNTLTVLAGSQLSGPVPAANGGVPYPPTSGSVLCGTSSTTEAWSAALTANLPLIGAGAGACPASGARTGNTTTFVTNTGGTTSGVGASWDASGNLVNNTNIPFTNAAQTWTGAQTFGPVIGTQNNQSGTSYTLAATDCGKTVYFTNAGVSGVNTLTTLNSLPVGCTIAIEQGGSGQVLVANGSGATFSSSHNYTKTFAQYAVIGLYVDTNSGGSSAHLILTGDGV